MNALLWFHLSFSLCSPAPQKPAVVREVLEIVVREALAIPPVGRSARAATHTDAIEAQIVAGKWIPPKEGDTVESPLGVRTWKKISAGKDEWFQDGALQGGYAYVSVDSPTNRVSILEAAGHGMVYVNGEPRGGDPYGFGYVHLPVQLKQGSNDFLFSVSRGRLRAKLTDPRAAISIDTADPTLPDLIRGEKQTSFGGIVVVNATTEPVKNLEIVTFPREGVPAGEQLPPIPPLSIRKVPVRFGPWTPVRQADRKEMPVSLLLRRKGATIFRADINLRVRQRSQTYKRTFISKIDGSVQYYAVNPMIPKPDPGKSAGVGMGAQLGQRIGISEQTPPALFLSLHGASVEAIGQADAYSPKSWGHIVCPTNRRPYGFDWEDWGRLDAMEVLTNAAFDLKTDPKRTYLTGHSMGGHGTWQVGATFPDQFAAIGPSAGWISFRSYAGAPTEANPSPVQQLLQRAASPSDTLALVQNYAEEGVYVLHGDADDNVPVTEERAMVRQLAAFHHDYQVHEQKGAGHWWDASDEPGADCVDWAPMFDLFAHHRRPDDEEVRQVDFITMNPAISSRSHWARVMAQEHSCLPSAVHLAKDPAVRRFRGTTENVARLEINVRELANGDRPIKLELDGDKFDAPSNGETTILLQRQSGHWSVTHDVSVPWTKSPYRGGPFKEAFNKDFVLVYGTAGNKDENDWAFAKARFDAESWYYRGNGAVDVMSDREFLGTKDNFKHNVILYGNADTNSAWASLISADCPIKLNRGAASIGNRSEHGNDIACLLIYPRMGSNVRSVGVVGGTGLSGMRLTDRLPYFVSGVAFPDVTLISPEMLAKGSTGILAAGFFGNDWKVESGDFAWRDSSEQAKR